MALVAMSWVGVSCFSDELSVLGEGILREVTLFVAVEGEENTARTAAAAAASPPAAVGGSSAAAVWESFNGGTGDAFDFSTEGPLELEREGTGLAVPTASARSLFENDGLPLYPVCIPAAAASISELGV